MKSRRISRAQRPCFVLCVNNHGYTASLDARTVYRVVMSRKSPPRKLLRVIDESNKDYLYPTTYFVPIHLPNAAKRLFSKRRSDT